MIYTKTLDAPLPQAGNAVLVGVEARRADSTHEVHKHFMPDTQAPGRLSWPHCPVHTRVAPPLAERAWRHA